jgi:ABC-type multidrug transport system permease subunit
VLFLVEFNVRYDTGFELGLIAFTAAVLGGIGNLTGAVLGAVIIGMIQAFNEGPFLWAPGSDWTRLAIVLAIAAAILLFNLHPHIDVLAVVTMILGTIAFVGLGMIIAAFMKNEDTAAPAASMMTFPLMFLSGTFFPVENMPSAFQAIAAVSPLTYVNAGLRDIMIAGNMNDGMVNMAIVAVIAVVLFAIGVLLMKRKED